MQYQLTRDDMLALLRIRMRIRMRERLVRVLVALAVLGVCAILLRSSPVGTVILIFLIVFISSFLVLYISAFSLGIIPGAQRLIRKNPLLFEERRVTITDDGLDTVLGATSTHTEWSALDHVSAVRGYLQVHRRGMNATLPIPERAFSSVAHRRDFLNALSDHGVELVDN